MKLIQENIKSNKIKISHFFAKESDQTFFGGTDSFFTNQKVPNNNPAIQRKCAECEQEEKVQKKEALTIQRQEADTPTAPPPPNANESFQNPTSLIVPTPAVIHIVEDNETPGAGQMRKTAFLNQLKSEICDTVNRALAGTPFSSDNCPYIRASFDKYQNSSPSQLMAVIIRYCPSAASAQSAADLIQRMKIKVYSAALQWALKQSGLSGASQVLGEITSGISSAASSVASGISSAVSGIGSLLFKENPGGANPTQSPQGVMQSLGKGNSIESGTRSKMEGAFGNSFSEVEIHTDSNAAQMSKDMNARAFTVGNHIAFASGEYQPGSMVGDALMAHELAHTIQQDKGETNSAQMKSGSGYSALEEDADASAVNVIMKLAGRDDFHLKNNVKNGLKSGLQLQRCGGGKGKIDAAVIKNAGIFEPYRNKQDALLAFLRSQPRASLFNPQNLSDLGNLYTDLTSNDYWYAEKILEFGPEPFWLADSLKERNDRGITGFSSAELGKSKGGLPIEAHFFPGKTTNRALIISGVHGSELSGIEVVRILIERLKKGDFIPFYSVIIVPRLFPDNAAAAENRTNKATNPDNDDIVDRKTNKIIDPGNIGRVTPRQKDPQRQNPDLGKAYDPIKQTDKTGKLIEPENIILHQLIERFKPARIASVHGKHLSVRGQSGIYADPRADVNSKALGFESDERLAIAMADRAAKGGARVPGNKLKGTKTALYPGKKEPPIAKAGDKQPRLDKDGYSLGGWGSTAVCDKSRPEANRQAMRIITIEVMGDSIENTDKGADQAKRTAELEGHADALREIFLGDNEVEADGQDPCAGQVADTPAPEVKIPK